MGEVPVKNVFRNNNYLNSFSASRNGNAVLVLNTERPSNMPFIVDFDGKYLSFVSQILILVV